MIRLTLSFVYLVFILLACASALAAESSGVQHPSRCVRITDSVTLKDGTTVIVRKLRCEYTREERGQRIVATR